MRNLKKITRWAATVGALALVLPTAATAQRTAAPADAPQPWRAGLDAMLAKAGGGTVRVVLTLSSAALDSQNKSASELASFDLPAETFQAGRHRLIAVFKSNGITAYRESANLPQLSAVLDAAQLRAVAQSGLVAGYEEEQIFRPTLAQSVPLIGAPTAWAANNKGQGQIGVVIDTGVMSAHSFLPAKIAGSACFSGGSSGFSTICPGGGPTAFGASDNSAGEPCTLYGCDHGTHVAGIIAGKGSFNGVAPEGKLISIQVFSNVSGSLGGSSLDLNSALQHAKLLKQQGKPIAAINMSLGGGSYSTPCPASAGNTTDLLAGQLRGLNVATVISSGNNNYSNAVGWPGCSPNAITVGASTKTDTIWNVNPSVGSNLAPGMIDYLAPGAMINSSVNSSTSAFAIKSGTSMAAPHMAGAILLMRQRFPCAPLSVLEGKLTATATVITQPSTGNSYRRINVSAAINALMPNYLAYACKKIAPGGDIPNPN